MAAAALGREPRLSFPIPDSKVEPVREKQPVTSQSGLWTSQIMQRAQAKKYPAAFQR